MLLKWILLPVLTGEKHCWLIAVLPRPLAGGKAIILGRVFNDGRNFYIFNYATFSLQTQISGSVLLLKTHFRA